MHDPLLLVCPKCQAANRVPGGRLSERPLCGACRALLLNGEPVETDPSSMAVRLRTESLPQLVDFWAPWCGPCRVMGPAFHEAAGRFTARARFLKMNTEAFPEAGAAYAIRGIPTLVLFRNGREVNRLSGALSADQLSAWLAPQL